MRLSPRRDGSGALDQVAAGPPRMTAVVEALGATVRELRGWPLSTWLVALAAAGVAALVTGIPTDMVPTPLFKRMTPVVWWDWPFWITASVLFGLVAASYTRPSRASRSGRGGVVVGGGILTTLAVGCPICNKLVVLALGTSGALTYFAPVQPLLGFLSVLLAGVALVVRTGWRPSCRLPALEAPPPAAQ